MARLRTTNSYDRALIGGFVASEETRRRKERDRERFIDTLSRHRGRDYIDRFDDRSRAYDIDALARKSMAVNRFSRSAFRGDMIMELLDIADMQQSPRVMQNYLLSDRRIAYYARNQRIEAWGRDMDEFDYPHESMNPYHRAMTDGYMMQSDKDPDDMYVVDWLCKDEDISLSYTEQRAVHYSRERLLQLLNLGGEDPTSKNNNML